MALILREYLESPITTIDNEILNNDINLNENFSNCDPISDYSIMVDIEGIHVGPTRNFTWYTEEALKNSQKSWSIPYQRPLILHHNEKDGKIIEDGTFEDLRKSDNEKIKAFISKIS